MGLSFHATGLGGVLNTQWSNPGMTEPSLLEAPTAPVRRLFQLQMIARGYFVAQRGMINLSLPMTERDIAGFVDEVREYLARHAGILPRLGNQARAAAEGAGSGS
jgi:glutamate-1-semialdehyde 2,1-aminomutase